MHNVDGPCFVFCVTTRPSRQAIAAFRRWLAEHHPQVDYVECEARGRNCLAYVEAPPHWAQSSMAPYRGEVSDAYLACNDAHPSPHWQDLRRRQAEEAEREATERARQRAEEETRKRAEVEAGRQAWDAAWRAAEARRTEVMASPESKELRRRWLADVAEWRTTHPDATRWFSSDLVAHMVASALGWSRHRTDGDAPRVIYDRVQGDLDLSRRDDMVDLWRLVLVQFVPDHERIVAEVRGMLVDLDARRARKAAKVDLP